MSGRSATVDASESAAVAKSPMPSPERHVLRALNAKASEEHSQYLERLEYAHHTLCPCLPNQRSKLEGAEENAFYRTTKLTFTKFTKIRKVQDSLKRWN